MFDFRSIWAYDRRRPPSGAIPRFPVWEVTAMLAVTYIGCAGLLSGSGRLAGLIGAAAAVFYAILAGGGFLALIGMLMRAPSGLLVQLVGYSALVVVSAAIGIGLAVDMGKVIFSGSTIFYTLVFGGTWRSMQLLSQLWRGTRQIQDVTPGPRQ